MGVQMHSIVLKIERRSYMKKGLALLLTMGLSVGLVACGGGSSSSSSSSAKAESSSSSAASSSSSTSEASSSSSSSSTASASGLKVGICLPTRDQYWTTFEGGVVDACEALGMEVQVVECKEDISTQIGQIESFKNNGFDAIVIGMPSGDSYQEVLDAAGDMDVVYFNRKVSDTSCLDGTKAIYVGMAEYDAGYAEGEWLADYFAENEPDKTELNGVMFQGILGQPSVTDRTQGAKDALEEAGYTVTWVFEDTAEWDRTKAMDKFTQFYGTGKAFDFVCSNNDEMALGVIEACSTLGVDVSFPIVGVDATEVGCQAIVDGTLKMTVNQDPISQGAVVASALVDMAADEVPADCDDEFVISTPAVPVTTDNVEEVAEMYK